jgi:23S rRNA (adenine2503-C2)-methyltransferase
LAWTLEGPKIELGPALQATGHNQPGEYENNKQAMAPKRTDIKGSSMTEIEKTIRSMGEPSYRAEQIRSWVFDKGVDEFEKMSNLPDRLRKSLSREVQVTRLGIKQVQRSKIDDTEKLLLQLEDGGLIESVLIREGKRRTACISTQLGCGRGCTYCATARMGLVRNLTAGEIVDQALIISRRLQESGERLSNVVLMGMGEPLDNRHEVFSAISNLTDPTGLGLGVRRVTLSTIGVVSGIKELAQTGIPIRLAVSLNAPNDRLRRKLMPKSRTSISELIKAARFYRSVTKREVTFEYVLIEGVNDLDEQAAELVRLLRGAPCKLNLICYNVFQAGSLRAPSRIRLKHFRAMLSPLGDKVSLRASKGSDITAACGQLATSSRRRKSERRR